MKERLKQVVAERRKALAAVATAVLVSGVYVVTGVNLDEPTAAAIVGALVALVVHEVPNAQRA